MVSKEKPSIPSPFTHEVKQHIDSAIHGEKRRIENLEGRISQLGSYVKKLDRRIKTLKNQIKKQKDPAAANRAQTELTEKEAQSAESHAELAQNEKQLADSHALIRQWRGMSGTVKELDRANIHLAKQKMGRKEARNLSEYLCLRISELPPAAGQLVERNLWLTLYPAIKADWVRQDTRDLEFWLLRAISRLDPANSAITDPFAAFLKDEFLAVRKGGDFVREDGDPKFFDDSLFAAREDGRIKISDARRGFSARMMERFVRAGIYEPTEDDIHHVFISNLNSENPQVRMAYRGILEHCVVKFSDILLDELRGINSSRQTSGIMSALASCGWDAIPEKMRAKAAVDFAGTLFQSGAPIGARMECAYLLSTLDPKVLSASSDDAKSVISLLGEIGAGIPVGGNLSELRDMCAKAARNLNTDGAFVLNNTRVIDLKEPGLQFILQSTDWQSFSPAAMVEMRLRLCNALLDCDPQVVIAAANTLAAIGPHRTLGGKEIGLLFDDTKIVKDKLLETVEIWVQKEAVKDSADVRQALNAAWSRLDNPTDYLPSHGTVSSSRALEAARRLFHNNPRRLAVVFPETAQQAKKPLPQKTG